MKDVFKVLAIDGGGALGVYPATILHEIEKHILKGKIVREEFDLIVGTSTGGLIALSLSSGDSPEDIVGFYEENCKIIFPNNFLKLFRFFNGILGRSIYSNKQLKTVLEKNFGNKVVKDLETPVCIVAVDTINCKPIVFKTQNAANLTRDLEYKLVDIALATSSAPIFFPTYQFEDFLSLIDGGIWQNNPSLIGLIEANTCFLKNNPDLTKVEVLSIGNPLSNDRLAYHKKNNFSSLATWCLKLVTLPMKVTANGVHEQMNILKNSGCLNLTKYLRIATENRPTYNEKIGLDSSSERALELVKYQASHDFNNCKRDLIEFFAMQKET